MKNTSIPFCKDIPDTWREIPNKYLFSYYSKKVGENWRNYQLLSLTTSGVKVKDINASGGKVPENYDNYQTVEPGDMIFCLFDLDVSAVFSGLSNLSGMITSAYDVVRPNEKLINQNFIDYWFSYVFSNRYYKMYSKNIRYTVGSDTFASIKTPIPSLKEQEIIGNFLSVKISELNSLMRVENEQINALKEYMDTLVVENIYKNPSLDTWKIATLKRVTKKVTCGVAATPQYVSKEEGILFLSAQNIQNNKIDLTISRYITPELHSRITKNTKPEKGDLIQVRVGASIGKCAIVDIDDDFSVYVSLSLIKPAENIFNRYLFYCLNSSYFRKMSESFVDYAGSQGNLNVDDIKKIIIPLPPINIQKEIVKKLDEKNEIVRRLIEVKNNKIGKLEEYRKSLIYELVTGKKEITHEI